MAKETRGSASDPEVIHFHHHIHFDQEHINQIGNKLDIIMATQDEEAAKLNAIGDRLDKAQAEILAALQALKDALAQAGNTSAAVDAATARLETATQSLDDINPDAAA